MHCPKCGALMNRHAEKPVKNVHSEESTAADHVPGEVIASIHYCPRCGKVEAEVTGVRS